MFQVNLYEYTTVKGPGKKSGSFAYVLEYNTAKGPATLSKIGTLEQVTENQAELKIIIEAIKKVTKQSEITIFTDCSYLKRGTEEWLPGWISAGWKNARGKPVANMEEWKEIAEMLGTHTILFKINEKHSYSAWLKSESEKREQERKSCTTNLENLTQQKRSTN